MSCVAIYSSRFACTDCFDHQQVQVMGEHEPLPATSPSHAKQPFLDSGLHTMRVMHSRYRSRTSLRSRTKLDRLPITVLLDRSFHATASSTILIAPCMTGVLEHKRGVKRPESRGLPCMHRTSQKCMALRSDLRGYDILQGIPYHASVGCALTFQGAHDPMGSHTSARSIFAMHSMVRRAGG